MELLHDDGTARFGRARNLVVSGWSDAPRVVQLHKLRRVLEGVAKEHEGDFGLLNVVYRGTPEFSAETRAALARLVGDPLAHGRGVAHVFLLGGLAGAAARVFLGTALLAGKATPFHKIFGGVDDAAAWLAPRLSSQKARWTAAGVVEAATELAAKAG